MRQFKRGDDVRREAAVRAANGHRAKAAGNVVMVEGRPYSIAQISARLGITGNATNKRLRAAQQSEGPVTWAKLGARG